MFRGVAFGGSEAEEMTAVRRAKRDRAGVRREGEKKSERRGGQGAASRERGRQTQKETRRAADRQTLPHATATERERERERALGLSTRECTHGCYRAS
eukprot:694351-Rhodomonas_salina.2